MHLWMDRVADEMVGRWMDKQAEETDNGNGKKNEPELHDNK